LVRPAGRRRGIRRFLPISRIGGDARYGVSVTIHGFWRFFGAGRHWDRRFDGSEKRSTRIGDLK